MSALAIKRMYRKREAAVELAISGRQLDRLIATKQVRVVKLGAGRLAFRQVSWNGSSTRAA